jgi:hypothetical protein
MVILAPAFCLLGLKMLLGGGAPESAPAADTWASPVVLLGVLLGVANAYSLGVWRSVSWEALREFWPFLIILGLIVGAFAVSRRRAKARAEASEK